MDFGTLVTNLQLNIQPFTRAMTNVRRQVQRFSSDMAAASDPNAARRMLENYTSLNDRLHRVGLGLRDIARISAGIVVSQSFYRAAQAIRDATNALWEFNETLDYAQVTYSALFNSTHVATDFLETLKEFSVDTIFEFSDLENMSRKLLAYGIEYKNLMYLVEGLTNIGTLSGDTAALERLAVAIGQINARGTLKAEEVRQLANAYVPVYDILQEKMGLSKEDLGNIGKLQIPAKDAINAIVEYANERFGNVATNAMFTITGLNNRIVDSMKVLGSEMIKPITIAYKSLAFFIANQLETIRGVYAKSGLGGVFESLVPSKEWQQRIRELLAGISNAFSTTVMYIRTLWPVISSIIGGIIDGFNMLLGVISVVTSSIAAVFQSIAKNTPVLDFLTKALMTAVAAWVLFRLQMLASTMVAGVRAAIVGVANAVLFLVRALVSNPIITLFVLFSAVLVGFAAKAEGANNAFGKLLKTIQSYAAGGKTADDILQVGDALDESVVDSDKFWESMEDGAEGTGDAVDKAGKAAKKAASGLLSFDEVFKIPEKADSSASGIGDFGDVLEGLGDLGSIGGASLLPEIPDFAEYAKKFVTDLTTSLWEALQSIAGGAATGALIGGLIGFVIGGLATNSMAGAVTGARWGARIGAIVGGAFAGFWTDAYNQMEASLQKIAIGAGIGILVGGLIGMVIGAFATRTLPGALLGARYGAAIGALIGTGLGGFWAGATEEMSNVIEAILVGGAQGALIGGLIGLVLGAFSTRSLRGALTGAAWGAAIGGLIGGGLATIFSDFEGMLESTIGQIAVGSATGALIGGLTGLLIGAISTKTLAGALTGAKWGAAIGTLVGGGLSGIFSTFDSELQAKIKGIAYASSEGALIGGLVGLFMGAFATRTLAGALTGAKYGAMIGAVLGGGLEALFGDAEETIGTRVKNLFSSISAASYGALIGGVVGMIIGAIVGAAAGGIGAIPGAKAGASLGSAIGAIGGLVYQYLADAGIIENIKEWLSNLWDNFTAWLTITGENIAVWWAELWSSIEKWFKDLGPNIKAWWENLWIVRTWKSAWDSVKEWWANLKTNVSNWFTTLKTSVKTWWEGLWQVRLWRAAWPLIELWWTNLKTSINSWFTTAKTNVKTWWEGLWSIKNWTSAWSHLSSWFSSLFTDIQSWFGRFKSSIDTWWSNLWSDKNATVNANGTINTNSYGYSQPMYAGHARGGVFSREHIARFAEGNKAEAIIPLEDNTAMQPFVNAISEGILQGLAPTLAVSGNSNSLPPMYVGTLIADDRGLVQLYKKFEVYEAKEMARKGLS